MPIYTKLLSHFCLKFHPHIKQTHSSDIRCQHKHLSRPVRSYSNHTHIRIYTTAEKNNQISLYKINLQKSMYPHHLPLRTLYTTQRRITPLSQSLLHYRNHRRYSLLFQNALKTRIPYQLQRPIPQEHNDGGGGGEDKVWIPIFADFDPGATRMLLYLPRAEALQGRLAGGSWWKEEGRWWVLGVMVKVVVGVVIGVGDWS